MKIKALYLALACASLLPFLPAELSAGAPLKIGFQGRLDESGAPAEGTKTFVFKLYDAVSGGSLVWTGDSQSVTLANGVFNATLSAGTPALSTAAFTGARYIEITVDGVPLSPRQEMVSAPYALVAQSLAPDAVFSLSTAAVTSGKFGDDRVQISTAAVSGLSSYVSLAATQTFTGANTFVSSAAFTFQHAGDPGVRVSSGLVVAAGRTGIGTASPNSILSVNGAMSLAVKTIASADSPYSLTEQDSTILVDASAGDVLVVLPPAASAVGRVYIIKRIDESLSSNVTIAGNDYSTTGLEIVDMNSILSPVDPTNSFVLQSAGDVGGGGLWAIIASH